MTDDLRAAEALRALVQIDETRIEYKSNVDGPALSVDGREVTTLFSVDCLDSVGDITPVSAFRTSLQGKAERIPHLFMHDLTAPAIALIRSFEELSRKDLPADVQAEYPDATGGLACVSSYLTTPRADEIFQGIKAGVPYQASFGYQVLQATPHRSKKQSSGKPARVLNEVRLFEVSTTQPNHAAQPATRVRLGKALALVEEWTGTFKAGRRHSQADEDLLNEIVLRAIMAGATNAQLIADAAPDAPVGTSPVDALIHDIEVLYEVTP
jgi:hypothetical protein